MIMNFPESISASIVNNFFFGDAEAKDDILLKNCHVPTSAINELIQDRKDIVLGYRGTGKSAIVRLFEEGIFSFNNADNKRSVVVVLDEEFDYRSIKSHLSENSLKGQKIELICRAVWEVLILYNVMTKIREEINNSDSTINSYLNDIEALLGLSKKKTSFFEILLSHKKKVGVKFDTMHPNIVDTYIGMEPTTEVNSDDTTVLKIGEYKKYLNKLLAEKSMIIHVLFDRLDDFVIHEEYKIQKLLLQELLSTQRTFREKCPKIRVKTFFRTDLFDRLDLSQFGADKIYARCINLTWKSTDIKRFISQRIGHNLLTKIPLSRLEIQIDKDRFYIDRNQLSLYNESKSISKFNPFLKSHWQKLFFKVGIELRKKEDRQGRITNATDVINEEIITSIFPRQVGHKKMNGEVVQIDFFKFLDTHLQFSHGETTPRAVLLFLDLFLNEQKIYYQQNSDIKQISKNSENEFALFLKKNLTKAYSDFCNQSWKIQYQWAQNWTSLVGIIEKFSHIGSFTFFDFQKKSLANADEARHFLAFAAHTGLIKCTNERDALEARTYEIPILFRKCKIIKKETE